MDRRASVGRPRGRCGVVEYGSARNAARYRGDPCGISAAVIRAVSCWAPGCDEGPARGSRGLCRAHHEAWLRDGGAARALAGAEAPPGSPLPMLEAVDASGIALHRRTDCSSYNGCLSWANARRWPGFSCAGCRGPALTTAAKTEATA